MKNKIINKIEDIYPLTIVKMRYGDKIVIFNSESDNSKIHDVQLGEEPHYELSKWLEENISPQYYGFGNDINSAFENFKQNYEK